MRFPSSVGVSTTFLRLPTMRFFSISSSSSRCRVAFVMLLGIHRYIQAPATHADSGAARNRPCRRAVHSYLSSLRSRPRTEPIPCISPSIQASTTVSSRCCDLYLIIDNSIFAAVLQQENAPFALCRVLIKIFVVFSAKI